MNCPLTMQYMDANRAWLHADVWGVSAQGGTFQTEEKRTTLLSEDAVDRAQVVRSDGQAGAVEEPILWALGAECA